MENICSNLELQNFHEDLTELGISLSEEQTGQFVRYYELLTEWNSFMNLTAITEFSEVLKKHFIDSLSIIKEFPELKNQEIRMIDIGTGAGFPGIPIKIAFPQIKVTLLDSLQKRLRFLEKVVEELELKDVELIHGRAEDYARLPEKRETYDFCVSRAVANLSTLSELCMPYVKTGGIFVSYKSEKITEEADAAQNAIRLLGGQIYRQAGFYLPNSDIYRNLFQIKKIKETPEKYPRKAGIPSKQPL